MIGFFLENRALRLFYYEKLATDANGLVSEDTKLLMGKSILLRSLHPQMRTVSPIHVLQNYVPISLSSSQTFRYFTNASGDVSDIFFLKKLADTDCHHPI